MIFFPSLYKFKMRFLSLSFFFNILFFFTVLHLINVEEIERVTGRKARGLQMEEIGCKCQIFFSLLSGRRKQTTDIFSFSLQISKEVSLKILCCHNDTWFHLKLTILKP